MDLKFNENYVYEMADLDEISKEIMAEQDMNVYEYRIILLFYWFSSNVNIYMLNYKF